MPLKATSAPSFAAYGPPGLATGGRGGGGVVGSRGPSGEGRHVPSAFVTFITRSLCVAYRQPSGPTATKSPRLPPVKMSVNVGGVVVRSTLVIIPPFRLMYRNGVPGVAESAIPSPSLKGKPMMVTAPGVAEFVPAISASLPRPDPKSVPSAPNAIPSTATLIEG